MYFNKNASLPAQKHPMPISRRVKANISNGLQGFSQTASFPLSSFFTLSSSSSLTALQLLHDIPGVTARLWFWTFVPASFNWTWFPLRTRRFESLSPSGLLHSCHFLSESSSDHLFVFQHSPQAQALSSSLPCFILIVICSTLSLSLSHVSFFATPWTVASQAPLSMEFSNKNTGMGCNFLLQWIFPDQGLNPLLPHCRQILHLLSHWGSPSIFPITFLLLLLLFFCFLSFSTRMPDLWRLSLQHRKRLGRS